MNRAKTVLLALCGLIVATGTIVWLLRDASEPSRESSAPASSTDADVREVRLAPRPPAPNEGRDAHPSFDEESLPSPEHEVRGVVVRYDGAPATAAAVRYGPLEPYPSPMSAAVASEILTDREGRFVARADPEWPAVPLWFAAGSDDGSAATAGQVVVAVPTTTVRLVLVPSATVEGRVHGVPEGAHASTFVACTSDYFPEHPNVRLVRIREDGYFRVVGVREFCQIEARVPGHAPDMAVTARIRPGARTWVDLDAGASGHEATVRLVLTDGSAVPSGCAILAGSKGQLLRAYVPDATGTFKAQGLTAGEALRVAHMGLRGPLGTWWAPPEAQFIPASHWQGATEVVVTLRAGTNPRFSLRDAAGAPMAGVRVTLVCAEPEPLEWFGTVPDDGIWIPSRHRALLPGRYVLRLADGNTLWEGELASNLDGPELDVVVEDRRLVTIQVLDATNAAVADDRIAVALVRSPDDPAGRAGFWASDVNVPDARGRARLLVSPQALGTGELVLRAGQWTRELDLDGCERRADGTYVVRLENHEYGRLEGRVVYGLNMPAPGINVYVYGTGIMYAFTTDEQGRFWHPWLFPGTYRVKARQGGVLQGETRLEIQGGQRTDARLQLAQRPN